MKKGYDFRNIKMIREKLGLKIQAVSDSSGIAYRTLQDVESGKSISPGIDILFPIAKALGVTVDDFCSDPDRLLVAEISTFLPLLNTNDLEFILAEVKRASINRPKAKKPINT
jgi:transcriptional regulator with XRE-family HTH domain